MNFAPTETELSLSDLGFHLHDVVDFNGRKMFLQLDRRNADSEWRGAGHYRALTEQQEEWAHTHGYHELIVKTKNKHLFDARHSRSSAI